MDAGVELNYYISALSAFVLAYVLIGLILVWAYRVSHSKKPEVITKRPGVVKGILYWPKLALTLLRVALGESPSDALCSGNCTVCPFNHDHSHGHGHPETFTIEDE